VKRFAHESTQLSIGADAELIDQYEATIQQLETHLVKHAKVDDPKTYHLLQSAPGIGKGRARLPVARIRVS